MFDLLKKAAWGCFVLGFLPLMIGCGGSGEKRLILLTNGMTRSGTRCGKG